MKLSVALAIGWEPAIRSLASAVVQSALLVTTKQVRESVCMCMEVVLVLHPERSMLSGPCGVVVQGTTSDETGQQHCPWAVTVDGTFSPLTFQSTHTGYLAVDVNASMPDSYWTQRELFPLNGSYIFKVWGETDRA